ncbi:hypothetical protein GCM10023185_20320 [Hymenobacter saemangeumensis]|uniref:Uncharacterized protein n=1 Tax=Hymenobacter saemangeumensis TaxID=1084522 RepID=A0ABP8IDQ5_9BACT
MGFEVGGKGFFVAEQGQLAHGLDVLAIGQRHVSQQPQEKEKEDDEGDKRVYLNARNRLKDVFVHGNLTGPRRGRPPKNA